MEFRLLGPVEVWDDKEQVPIGGTKPRTLLAALLLEHGRVVPARHLIDVMWSMDPPETAKGVIQTYISGLRRALHRPGRADVIRTRPAGYLIEAGAGDVDRVRFEQLAGQARRAVAAERYEEAVDRFRAALDLWRGPALGGIAGPLLASEAARLDEMHLAVLEERVAADLVLGRHEALVSELTALVRSHPTREMLRRHLMVALYQADRRADALDVYRQGRRALVDQLGVEPGPALQTAHEAILRSDPGLLAPGAVTVPAASRPAPARPSAVVPCQLPSVPTDFTGRAAQILELVTVLGSERSATGMPTCVISGKGGAGKSTLAVRAAHELVAGYPDGQLYLQLHGMSETPETPDAILARVLSGFGVAPADLPATLDERVERYRSLIAGRRVLVVLDDAASEQQVRPLLPGSSSCAVIITARTRLGGLAGTHLIELEVLTLDEADDLLARMIGQERVAAEPAAARRLVELSGRMPLAVRIAGARLATRRYWSLEQLCARLTDEHRRLDELVVGDQEVRASIALSYQALDPQARTAFRRLGQLGVPNFPTWVVSALLDVTDEVADDVIERLVDAHLVDFASVDTVGQTRFQVHDLLRIYAAERARDEEDGEALKASVHRVLGGLLRIVDKIVAGNPTGGMAVRFSQAGTAGPTATQSRALADPRGWFEAEQYVLVAGVERAAQMDLTEAAADLASALCGSLFVTNNLFDAWTRTHDAALASARRTGNKRAEARLIAEVGQLRYEQDRYAEARTYLVQALSMFRECGDVRGEAVTLAMHGTACREQGYLLEALHFLDQSDRMFGELGDQAAAGYTSRLSGSVHLELGNFAEAQSDLRAAMTNFRRVGSRRGEALTLRTMSLVHRALGEYDRAYEVAVQARMTFRELGDNLLESYAARAAAKAQIRLGCHTEAAEHLEYALITARRSDDRWGEAMALRTLGEMHLAAGRLEPALRDLNAAVLLWQALDLPLARARTLRDLAEAHRARGDVTVADRMRAEAVDVFRLYGVREYAELTGL
jgi:DNA-binding SARP family transcriptional activator